jgi:uncharacterized protein YrrD
MRLDEIKDTLVMSIAEGTTLGAVQDLLLDDSYLQLAAVVIGGGGILGRHRRAVAYGEVRGIGRDAVMVSGQDAVHEVGDSHPFGRLHRLGELRQQVMSESGVRLGRVEDVEFDAQTGAVTALRFAPAEAAGLDTTGMSVIARAELVNLTAKTAVVRHTALAQRIDEAREGSANAPAIGEVVTHDAADIPVHDPDVQPAAPVR